MEEGSLACAEVGEVECDFCKQRLLEDFTQACFIFDKDLDDVIEKSTKTERRKHLDKFLKMVNVLLNEGGGVIYIHTKQHLLAFWDEQVDENLMDLVPDDTLFHENFERSVIAHKNHVIFRVKPRDRPFSTREFNSKVSLNKGLVDPTHSQMRRLMQTDREPPDDNAGDGPDGSNIDPRSLQQGQAVRFNESVYLQAKVVLENKLKKARGAGRSSKLINYWWAGEGQGLKLPQYIAAFSKQGRGGSFFLGLSERKVMTGRRWLAVPGTDGLTELFDTEKKFWKDDKNENLLHLTVDEHVPKYEHKTGEFMCEGVSLTTAEKRDIEKQLKDRIRQNLLWLPLSDAHDARPEDIIEVFFHPVSVVTENNTANHNGRCLNGAKGGMTNHSSSEEAGQLYVVEARVRYFHGVCFQTQKGPEAYEFENLEERKWVRRVAMRDWTNHQRCNS